METFIIRTGMESTVNAGNIQHRTICIYIPQNVTDYVHMTS